jgi:hypothetical protein
MLVCGFMSYQLAVNSNTSVLQNVTTIPVPDTYKEQTAKVNLFYVTMLEILFMSTNIKRL